MAPKDLIDIFESQVISRHLDFKARKLKEKGLGYYTIGSSGHEGNAVFGHVFPYTDMAFLHYRSGAFMVQRSKQCEGENPIKDILLSIMASKDDPISSGRHKVFGSVRLNVPPQTSTIASHLPKAVGAALSIVKANELKLVSKLKNDSIILCSFGDASFNHAVAQTAFNTVQWLCFHHYPLPLIFICEDNGLGISTPTSKYWIKENVSNRVGIKYLEANGLDLLDTYDQAQQAINFARLYRKPVFLHFRCIRLLGHAGSDLEQEYRTLASIEQDESQDPLLYSASILLETKTLSQEEILNLYELTAKKVETTSKILTSSAVQLSSKQSVMSSLFPIKSVEKVNSVSDVIRKKSFGEQWCHLKRPRTLAQCINYALIDIMLRFKHTVIFGEDVARKGGVYHVTSGLLSRFGQRRVFDTILDETMILGTAIGLAHNKFLPIPEIQFLAYYHNAQDQVRGEAASLSFFSSGQFRNPMIIRIPGFSYQKGFGGHFHNENSISIFRDVPGLIVASPSNGSDAVMMLRACVDLAQNKGCIIVFIEPIALYATKDLFQSGDLLWLSLYPSVDRQILLGEIGVFGKGTDLIIISYANGVYLSRQAENKLRLKKIDIKIIDLRWLKPLPIKSLKRELIGYRKVLIVDECRKGGSISEEILLNVQQILGTEALVQCIGGEESFLPLGHAAKLMVPSVNDIVEAATTMVIDTVSKKETL